MRSCARGPQRGGSGQLGSKIFPSPLNLTPHTHTFTHPHHQVPTVVKVMRHSAMFDYHNDMWEYATPPICPVCTRYDQFVNTSTLLRHAFFIFMLCSSAETWSGPSNPIYSLLVAEGFDPGVWMQDRFKGGGGSCVCGEVPDVCTRICR